MKKKRKNKSGAAVNMSPVSKEHVPLLKKAFEKSGNRAWCAFAPFLFFTSDPTGRNQVFIHEHNGSAVVLYRKRFKDRDAWNLYTLAADTPESARYAVDLMDRLNENSSGRILWIPEPQVEHLKKAAPDFICEHRDTEYFYDTKLVSKMRGPQFADVRKKYNRCKRENPGIVIIPLEKKHTDECIELCEDWKDAYHERGLDTRLVDHFYTRRSLIDFDAFDSPDFFGRAAVIDGRIAAFALAGEMAPDLVNFFALKTDISIRNLSTFMRVALIREFRDMGYSFVNDASDLNMPGLQRHKTKFRPVGLLKIFSAKRTS